MSYKSIRYQQGASKNTAKFVDPILGFQDFNTCDGKMYDI